MNRQNAIIIIIFVGILGFLSGLFVAKWREGQKPKASVMTRYSEFTAFATVIKRVEPTYPPSALKDRIEGTVRLMVTVGKGGSASSTTVVKGVRPDIDSAATEALKLWKFAPSSGMAIISLDFELDKTKKTDR